MIVPDDRLIRTMNRSLTVRDSGEISMRLAPGTRTWLRKRCYSAALRRESPELMRPFMMLLGRNTKTRRGVIGTS